MEIKVFCEFERKRLPVGTLSRDAHGYCFVYAIDWLRYSKQFPLASELPLRTEAYRSVKLFEAFLNRIPPRNSENYLRYCQERGISPEEKDEFILLGTVAHKGASSFVFEIDRSHERHAYVIGVLQTLVENFSYDIIAAGFGVAKTGLYKLLSREVAPEKSAIYATLELCVFSLDGAQWKLNEGLMLPDTLKHKLYQSLRSQVQDRPYAALASRK